jgi:mRNA interferase RelE/StbE
MAAKGADDRDLHSNIAICDISCMRPIAFTATSAQWAKLSPDVRNRIDKRLMEFAKTGHGDLKRLRGREGMRLRIGEWRVIFYEDQGNIIIAAVGHRREVYD